MCSQNFHLLGPITFLPDNYSLIFFVLLSNKSWYNSICSCEWFLFLTSNWKNSNLIDLQHCSLYLYSLILMSSLKYTNMCMLASYQWDAMLNGKVKPWMTVHSLRSQLTRKLHTHRRVYRYVRYWKCIPNGSKACVYTYLWMEESARVKNIFFFCLFFGPSNKNSKTVLSVSVFSLVFVNLACTQWFWTTQKFFET